MMKRGIRLISWLAVFLVMMQGVVPVLGATDEKLQEESSEIFSKADSSIEKKENETSSIITNEAVESSSSKDTITPPVGNGSQVSSESVENEAQGSSEDSPLNETRFQLAYQLEDEIWHYAIENQLNIDNHGEAIKGLKLRGIDQEAGSEESILEFRGHYSEIGWNAEGFSDEAIFSEPINQTHVLEAFALRLKENLREEYSVYYQVYTSEFSWLGWAKNGEIAGSMGYGCGIEKINICILPASEEAPTNGKDSFVEQVAVKNTATIQEISASVQYQAHVESVGWQNTVKDGATAGTTGVARRIEAIKLNLSLVGITGDIEYRSHIENLGWSSYSRDGAISGTTGRKLQLEALQIRLVGEVAQLYDVYYRVHVKDFGWLDWAKNDVIAGTTGFNYRIEAYEVRLVEKTGIAPGTTTRPNVIFKQPNIRYSAHVQDYGWTLGTQTNGNIAGTTGRGKRIEALKMSVDNLPMSGGVEYRVHGANYGWQTYRKNGEIAGTTGQGLRVEAVNIRLTGEVAKHFDVYYRIHTENLGWLGWAKNGEHAGTTGMRYQAEGLQVVLFLKGRSNLVQNSQSYVTHKINSIKAVSRYVRVYNNSNSAFSNEPTPFSTKNASVARFRGYMGRAIKEADTTSGRYYFLVAPGGNLGWVKASETENVQSNFWMYNTDGPYPSLNVSNLNISVSVSQQRVRIRSGSRTLYTMLCSTGMSLWPSTNSTPYGNFRIQAEKGSYFWNSGSGGAFYRSFHGHGVYLFHTVPIATPGTTVFNLREAAKLGQRASHGCIRLSVPDAKWFYYNMPYNTPVHIYY